MIVPHEFALAWSPGVGRNSRYPGGVEWPVIPIDEAVFESWPPSIICDIPKVEGYSAYVHPKVLDTGADRWNGHRYWMCNTNYPGTMDRYENPAIFVSEDGTSWAHFGDNPVVPVGEGWVEGRKYNSDPHILLWNDTLYLYWRVFDLDGVFKENLFCKTLTAGGSWSEDIFLFGVREDWSSGLLAPTIEHHDGEFFMWAFRDRTSPTSLVLWKADNPLGPWGPRVTCDFAMPSSAGARQPWHLDVVRNGAHGWAMLFSDRKVDPPRAWLAYGSNDGLEWSVRSEPMNSALPAQYRPTLIRTAEGFDCWLTNNSAKRLERVSIVRAT